MAAVLGCGEYRSRMDIMESKIKAVYGDYIRACSFGIFFEDLHRTLISHCVGCEIVVPPPKIHCDCEYIRYSADGLGFLEDGQKVLFEFKTPYSKFVIPSSKIKIDYEYQIQCGMMVYPDISYTNFSELGLYILKDSTGTLHQLSKRPKNFGDKYKNHIYCIEIDKQYIPDNFIQNSNVLFSPDNGETDFDELFKILTKNGKSIPYITHLQPIEPSDKDKVYMYCAKYQLNIIKYKT